MAISTTDIRKAFTSTMDEVWKDKAPVYSFLRSYFPTKTVGSMYIDHETKRFLANEAAAKLRGDDATMNKAGISTFKKILPAYYKEGFRHTELEIYNQPWGVNGEFPSGEVISRMIAEIKEQQMLCIEKIERAIERQCASVLNDGTVVTADGTIDFKRQADMVATDTSTANVFSIIDAKIQLALDRGAISDEFDVILGDAALSKLIASTEYKDAVKTYPITPSQYVFTKRNSVTGSHFIATVSTGKFTINVWGYNGFGLVGGVKTNYVDSKKMIIIPKSAIMNVKFAQVPMLADNATGMQKSGDYWLRSYVDGKYNTEEFYVEAAAVATLTTVDHIATVKIVA